MKMHETKSIWLHHSLSVGHETRCDENAAHESTAMHSQTVVHVIRLPDRKPLCYSLPVVYNIRSVRKTSMSLTCCNNEMRLLRKATCNVTHSLLIIKQHAIRPPCRRMCHFAHSLLVMEQDVMRPSAGKN